MLSLLSPVVKAELLKPGRSGVSLRLIGVMVEW
jgi:hypothetical protein